MQDPNEDTQWNDVLRSKGILPPKEEATIDEDTLVQVSVSDIFVMCLKYGHGHMFTDGGANCQR